MIGAREIFVLSCLCAAFVFGSHQLTGDGHVEAADFNVLASQCGFKSAYLALKVCGRDVRLLDLIADYVGDSEVEINGLGAEKLATLISKHGPRCQAGVITRETFDSISYDRCIAIPLMKDHHFQVAINRDGEDLLTIDNYRCRWVSKEALWNDMSGIVVLVYRPGQRWTRVPLLAAGIAAFAGLAIVAGDMMLRRRNKERLSR